MYKNMYDVREFLKKYNTFIYTGDKLLDLDLMELEINELKKLAFIDQQTYIELILIIRKERRLQT